MIRRVLVAGGGTGGHLFPGIAVVEELRRRYPSVDVMFVGTARGIESRVLAPLGEKLMTIDVAPLKGRTPREIVAGLVRVPGALQAASRIVREHDPDVVLGTGGYASGPMLLAASLGRRRTAILEQNVEPGITNRLLAPFVSRAYCSFAETAEFFGRRARVVGNPIRRAFVDRALAARSDPDARTTSSRPSIVVLGGSQGARKLNEVLPDAFAELLRSGFDLEIVHQAGLVHENDVRAAYARAGVPAEVVGFVERPAELMARASIVVSRAGATAIAELCAIGSPTVYVPFAGAADDHQKRNAEALVRAGAAIMLEERELDVARFVREIGALMRDPSRRSAMADAARAHGRPDAAASVVDDLEDWIRGSVRPGGVTSGSAEIAARAEGDDEETEDRSSRRATRYGTVSIGAVEHQFTAPRRRQPRVRRDGASLPPSAYRRAASE